MYIQKFQSAAGSKITVTATATNIFNLINTAQSTTLPFAGFTSRSNSIIIQPEDGDIRFLMDGNTPTAANGFLIKSGEKAVLLSVPLQNLSLIRVSGNVAASIQIGISDPNESTSFTSSGGGSSGAIAIDGLTPGTDATELGKAEDAQHTSGDVGVMSLGVSNETMANFGANNDYTPIATDVKGRPVVTGSVRALKGRQTTTITSSTAETTIVTQQASTFLDIYRLVIANSSASPCLVTIKDSTGGTTVDVIEVPANGTAGWSGPESAAANQTTVNNNWTATCGTSVASIIVTAYYVRNT